MDRSREARRVAMPTSNGLTRRRHRTSSLRDSPEDDGPMELQESARFRDRTGKRDKDREKDRSERDRLSRSKRRRGEKYMQGSNREDGVDDSSEESLNDEDEEDLDDAPVRFVPPNPVSVSSSSIPSSALISSRKSYPPPSKVFKVTPSWRGPNETIGFSIPRRARSASTKRAHDSWSSAGVVGEQILRQTSSSPVRPSMAASSTVASPSPAPMSPSSSSLSIKKKIKANGPKQRPQKSSSKSPFTVQDDIEIEVAEVLYGLMRQSQGSSKQELMPRDSARYDSREANRSTGDSKSRASSPVSNSGSVPAQDSPAMPQNTSSSAPPLSAVAPKRKRPRPVNQPEENPSGFASRSSPISAAPKMEPDLPAKREFRPPKSENNSDSAAENGVSLELMKSHGPQPTRETVRSEPASGVLASEEKRSSVVEQSQGKDTVMVGKVEEVPSSKKESVDDHVHYTAIKQSVITTTSTGEKESRREEKFEIDLMAPPPQSRSSPEREGEMDHRHEPMVADGEAEIKSKPSEGEKAGRAVSSGNTDLNAEVVEKGSKSSGAGAEDADAQKLSLSNKAKNIDLHLDLERIDRRPVPGSADDNKLNQQLQKQPPLKSLKDDTSADKSAQTSSLPLSLPVPAGWPAGLPPMGYVAPVQGVVSMDGRTMAPTAMQPPHFLFAQPRPGRCATHCYIAKNIYSHQQLMKNYSFWPAAAGAAPLFGAKPYNLNVVPAADLHGNAAGRADVNPAQDKGQTLAFFPGQQAAVKDKGAQPAANMIDGAQKKQFYQSLPPGGPSNLLHPATFFFPMGQQVAAAARTNSTRSPVPAGTAASASMSTSVPNASATAGQASSTTMSFNYPNANETQYLAILANGAYPFPIPAHVGAAQAYRGAHAHGHVMPFFDGSYYPSQILQPSRVQPPQPVQIQPNHQNPSISIASSSSQKHPQNQQQRPQGSSANGVTTNPALQNFPAPKTRASQTQQLEMGVEGSPTADSRLSRPPNMSPYGQNFALPLNHSNFAFMSTPASLSGATNSSATNGNHAEKKQQQPPQAQLQALKTSVESLVPQAFAMSFASINGATASLDITSMAKNHAILQSPPDTARNNYHTAAQQKNYHGSEDGKSGAPDSSNVDDERKGTAAKASASSSQSIAFSRPEFFETSVATVSGNNVVNSSGRSLNVVPGSAHSSRSSVPNAISNSPASSSQQQQFVQLHKQPQFAAAATARNKAPVTSNGSVYPDQLAAVSTMAAKFPNAVPGYPPSVVQGSNTSTQSPQWKNYSGRPITSQVSSPSIATPVTTSMKGMGQHQGRTQPGQTQISFGGNSKAATASQGQQGPNVTQSPSPPMMVGSPSTSSVSKGHSGSPRMTSSSSVGNKLAQASSLSTQPGKNSPSVSSQKSSPAAGSGRNMPSVFGSNYMPVSSSMGSSKPQLQQQSQHQLQQPQLSKQSIQQAQMFFSNGYLQTHSTTSSPAASAVGGFQLQRHRTEQHQLLSKSQGAPTTTSANATTNDPAKAVAAAGNIKGGKQPPGTLPATGFPYVHEVVAAPTRMQAERKQTAD